MNKFQKQLSSIRQQKKLLVSLIFAFMLAVSWVGVSLLSSQKEIKLESKYLKMAKPLIPKLDDIALARIKNKEEIQESELDDFPIYIFERTDRGLDQLVKITANGVTWTVSAESEPGQDQARLNLSQDTEFMGTVPPTPSTTSAIINEQATPSAVKN